jgi:hypothetical protein
MKISHWKAPNRHMHYRHMHYKVMAAVVGRSFKARLYCISLQYWKCHIVSPRLLSPQKPLESFQYLLLPFEPDRGTTTRLTTWSWGHRDKFPVSHFQSKTKTNMGLFQGWIFLAEENFIAWGTVHGWGQRHFSEGEKYPFHTWEKSISLLKTTANFSVPLDWASVHVTCCILTGQ